MAKYLLTLNYSAAAATAAGARAPALNSQLETAARNAVASVGGTTESFYFAFGGTDAYLIADFKDHVAVAAVALAISSAAGHRIQTVVLIEKTTIDATSATSASYMVPEGWIPMG